MNLVLVLRSRSIAPECDVLWNEQLARAEFER